MNLQELLKENERLRKSLADSQAQLIQATAQHEAVSAQFSESLEEKQQKISTLEHQLKLLLQKIKGSRQERIDPDQLLLFSPDELQEMADQMGQGQPGEDLIDDQPAGKRRRKSPGRVGKLPGHLQREIIRYELSPEERLCPCCGEERQEIGVESSEQLELIPARLKVLQHDRVKYACRSCQEHVATAAKPPQPIEKGLPGPGLCAHTILSKFGDHQPYYRDEDIHSRLGMTIRRSTLCGWQAALAELALPLVLRMKFLILQSQVIHTDDTSIKMLQPGRGTTQTAKFWPYLGDWLHPYAVYDFTLTRERDGPQKFLDGFKVYLQADAYSGYDAIFAGDQVLEVACWVHARRYWHQALDNDPLRANHALGFIAQLSQIETQLRKAYPALNLQGERDFAAVAAARQEHSVPILTDFKTWLDTENEDRRILPKSPIRAAFTYALNQWEALCRYTEQGFLAWDNNVAERLVKLPAIGRKNFLFVGSPNAGRGAATMYSLVSSAKANGVEPFAWLRDVFTRLPYFRGGDAFTQAANRSLPTNWTTYFQTGGLSKTRSTCGQSTRSAEKNEPRPKPANQPASERSQKASPVDGPSPLTVWLNR
ncbi:MAG: IS66 family transposase [Pirellulaceae bacterium]